MRKQVLNAGSGPKVSQNLHSIFRTPDWREIRLDIDPGVKPDLLCSIADMSKLVKDATFDSVWCSHNIEHMYDHEVGPALLEFRRVLKNNGFALITCPDIEAVARLVVEQGVEAEAYISPAGPIRALDILFGHIPSITGGNEFMAHRTGFTVERMGRCLLEAGFDEVRVARGPDYSLWAVALMPEARFQNIAWSLAQTSEAYLMGEPEPVPARRSLAGAGRHAR